MKSFQGFSTGKTKMIPIPSAFFTELLPEIDHLGELKVSIYIFWRLERMEGTFRYLSTQDLRDDRGFLAGLGATPEEAETCLVEALERAVERGTFLRAVIQYEDGEEAYYFLNTPKGRTAVQAIKSGQWHPSGENALPVDLISEPPNVYRLYEEHIGPLTPMIADALKDAEATYPPAWIEEAIRIAVENNKRSWRYAAAILNRWQTEGRDDRKDRQDSEKTRRRYAEWDTTGSE